MQYNKIMSRRRGQARISVWPVVLFCGALLCVLGFATIDAHRAAAPAKAITVQAAAEPSEVLGRYLLTGTTTWARAVERDADGNYAQPFSQLKTFNRSQYDAWSTDFECPITNNVVPFSEQVNSLVFNCRPEFLPAATKYFTIFDLANNHTDNQGGEAGLESTREYLQKAGVQYFGTFDPADSKNVCEVLALPVRVEKSDKSITKASLPVAFCGWHYVFRLPRAGEMDVMDAYNKIMPVFAFAEMGTEYEAHANATQQSIAHQIIDHQPEFLIANNPHWVQNTEVYKDKLVVYSTGNFIFDQLDQETNRDANIDLNITVQYDSNVAKWLALGPSCAAFHDDCLAKAQEEGLSKVQLHITYGIVAGNSGDRVVSHKADAVTQASVEQRMNWTTTCKQLTQAVGYNSCL